MTIQIKVPALGESVSEAAIAKLHKKVGDTVKADELIVELETDKVTLEVNAPANGVISEINVKEGDNVKVGDLIASMSEGGAVVASVQAAAPKASGDVSATSVQTTNTSHDLSPAPKKLAAENNVDVSKISGSGKDGRVTKGDVLEVMSAPIQTAAPKAPASFGEKPVERVKMSKLRLKVAERLKESQKHCRNPNYFQRSGHERCNGFAF